MNSIEVDTLKRNCPMPALLHKAGLGEFARNSCRSPFREDKKPSWGIFQRDGKWGWKDHGNGDGGDEITLLARWKGLDEKRDFQQLLKLYADFAGVHLNGETAQASTSTQSKEYTTPFDWSSCVAAVGPEEIQKLAQWRRYSAGFCAWLRSEEVMGLYRENWAMPVREEAGAVVACHYRVDRGTGEKADWFYHPKGFGARPLIGKKTKHHTQLKTASGRREKAKKEENFSLRNPEENQTEEDGISNRQLSSTFTPPLTRRGRRGSCCSTACVVISLIQRQWGSGRARGWGGCLLCLQKGAG